jgi:hypothetical protein
MDLVRVRRDLARVVSAFGLARFAFSAAVGSLAFRSTGLGGAWDTVRFGGRPAVLLWAGDSVGDTTAIPCHTMDMVSGGMVLGIMSSRKFTRVLCTGIPEKAAISFGCI